MERRKPPARPKIPVNRASSSPDLRHRLRATAGSTPQLPPTKQVKTDTLEASKSKKPATPKRLHSPSSRSINIELKIPRLSPPRNKPSLDKLSTSVYEANDRLEEVLGQARSYVKTHAWWVAGTFAVIVAGILIGIIISSYGGIGGQNNSGASAFPDSVSRDVLIPNGDGYKLDIKTVKHTKATGVISYSVVYINGTRVFVNQQLYPESFTNDPKTFLQMLAGMNSYGEAPLEQGKVYLTRPTELKGKQAIVSKVGKYLLFIKPSKDFTPTEASEFIASLEVISYDFPK